MLLKFWPPGTSKKIYFLAFKHNELKIFFAIEGWECNLLYEWKREKVANNFVISFVISGEGSSSC